MGEILGQREQIQQNGVKLDPEKRQREEEGQ